MFDFITYATFSMLHYFHFVEKNQLLFGAALIP